VSPDIGLKIPLYHEALFTNDSNSSNRTLSGELSCNVLFEDKHSAARAFAALSQELPSPPPELSNDDEKMDEAEDREDDEVIPTDEFGRAQAVPTDEFGRAPEAVIARAAIIAKGDEPNENDILPDFGGMGWRFCKWTARKASNLLRLTQTGIDLTACTSRLGR